MKSREAWLIHELQKLGCELREDSKLCEAYIKNGVGNPRKIAEIMQEMQFFHEHTQYASIRDRIYQEACDEYQADLEEWHQDYIRDRDFRPVFSQYFDSQSASESAKHEAFESWLTQWDSLETAATSQILPRSLKSTIYYRLSQRKFTTWVKSEFPHASEKQVKYVVGTANEYLRNLGGEAMTVSNAEFASAYKDKIAKYIDTDLAKTAFASTLSNMLVRYALPKHHAFNLTHYANQLIDSYSYSKNDLSKGIDAAAFVTEHLIAYLKQKEPVTTLADLAKLFFPTADDNAACSDRRVVSRILEHNMCFAGKTWCCAHCNYIGSATGLYSHCIAKHEAKTVFDVQGKTTSDSSVYKSMEREYCQATKMFETKYNAALTIQRHWRHAVTCPNYLVCKRRLMREAQDLGCL